MTAEIDVLDAEAAALEQPQAGAIEQPRHQPRRSPHVREHEAHLVAREHHRDVRGSLGAHEIVQPGKVACEHLSIEKE